MKLLLNQDFLILREAIWESLLLTVLEIGQSCK